MQVSRSPTARCTRRAATAESTPPESAQITRPSPPDSRACASTRERISAIVDSMKLAGVHVGRAPAIPITKLRSTSRPRGVCPTSGWNWIPYRPRTGSAIAANRVDVVRAVAPKPGGGATIESPWLIQTGCSGPSPANSGLSPSNVIVAELTCHQVQPVADPEDGDARAPHGRVRARRIGLVDARRPAGEDDRARTALRDLAPRRVEGQELRVDMQLPDAPRDQLRVLAAEVEDHDGVRLTAAALPTGDGPTGAVDRGAFGRGRIERGLEVRLHIRVVRGEDAMAGVGELSVNGLSALASGGLVVVRP